MNLRLASACYPASLAYGKIGSGHPFAVSLEKWGVKSQELGWFQSNARKPDILGYNFYPDFAYGWGENKEQRTKDFTKEGTIPLKKAARDAAALLTPGIVQAQRYFDLPVYLTETSAGRSIEARIAYINALGEWVFEMQRKNIPLKGVNWWPLFDTIQWDYRENTSLPLEEFIYEGGWNNGLYRIQAEAGGKLQRVSTPAAKAYRDMIGLHR